MRHPHTPAWATCGDDRRAAAGADERNQQRQRRPAQPGHRRAHMFMWASYLQVVFICIFTSAFMAGAIAQEANPQTWDILLTTPLNNLQIVLGNLFGWLSFVLALLFSSLPLFAVTQYFGGVPGNSIFDSYAIATCSAIGGGRGGDAVRYAHCRPPGCVRVLHQRDHVPVRHVCDRPETSATGGHGRVGELDHAHHAAQPVSALEVLLQSKLDVPHDPVDHTDSLWLTKMWFTRPIASFCWLCVLVSLFLMFSLAFWCGLDRRKSRSARTALSAKGALERPPLNRWATPVSWRESVARARLCRRCSADGDSLPPAWVWPCSWCCCSTPARGPPPICNWR